MKTVTVELPDDMAAAFERLSPAERVRLLASSLQKSAKERLQELLDRTAKQARQNGMTEKEIEGFIDSIS